MFFVIKERVENYPNGISISNGFKVDRLVETLDEVEPEEYFVKCNVKK